MNIHNDTSEVFERSLKNQSEIQSCKLNESESRPNIALIRIGQELNKAETKCFTLKSELNHMMDVCQKAQTEIKGNKETSDISSILSSFKDSGLKSPIEHNSKITAAFNSSPKSTQFSPRKSINDVIIDNLIEEKQKRLSNVAFTPRTQQKLPRSITTMSIEDGIPKVQCEVDREYESYYFPSNASFEKLTLQANKDCPHVPSCSSNTQNSKNFESNMSNGAKIKRVRKSRSRTERSEISSVYRMDNARSLKARKRKAKIRISVSKSTVTTKDTGFIGRKEAKRRRHKGHSAARQSSTSPKQLKKINNIVEIFHNNKLKNSNSESSKHSKVDGIKYERKSHLPETVERRHADFKKNDSVSSPIDRCSDNREYRSYENKNKQTLPQTVNYQNTSGITAEIAQDKSEKHSSNFNSSMQDKAKYERTFNKFDDPMFLPSYGMPTLASRLKRSNRSYFNKFNFQNIPFVVGTSVTPSHNLGLNIQQVLSVMKMKQPVVNDTTPLLIQKISRALKPSNFADQMNSRCEGSQMIELFNREEHLDQDKKSSVFNLQYARKMSTDEEMVSEKQIDIPKQSSKEKDNSFNFKMKQQSTASSSVNKDNTQTSSQNQQEISTIPKNIDHKIRDSGSHNSKEIRDVLINLHDQFEEMNTKYERLQSEANKSNDKSLAKELSALEKDLNAKEEEINAVVSLYKEVMTLKRQMKMMHEKNSLVCIATELAKETCKDTFPLSIVPRKSSMSPQIFGRRRFYSTTREPPASMQLAALLRQIQTFHKQLQLVS